MIIINLVLGIYHPHNILLPVTFIVVSDNRSAFLHLTNVLTLTNSNRLHIYLHIHFHIYTTVSIIYRYCMHFISIFHLLLFTRCVTLRSRHIWETFLYSIIDSGCLTYRYTTWLLVDWRHWSSFPRQCIFLLSSLPSVHYYQQLHTMFQRHSSLS